MLVFSNLGIKGNFGNQLFQVASTIGIANKNRHEFTFPKWEYAAYFDFNFPLYDEKLDYQLIKENEYCYNKVELPDGNYNLNGWFQSEKYFDVEAVNSCFKFKQEIINKVKTKYSEVLSKRNILISVRRGDFVNHPYYYQLDYKYYFLGIIKNFPDWKERTLIFTSDDINYCKKHFKFLKNTVFIDNTPAIEQLALGTLCKDFVISNSTFSWWLAWLGERQDSKIIRPIQNFRGKFRASNNDKDYFPDRWLAFNSKTESLGVKYINLIIKGTYFKFLKHTQYYYKLSLKNIKKFIKKIIGRK
ncbi:alpha-1,2-fucosyltransferase [Thalassobellus sediminis]|uniref:alpha-1,2-fucosyltransferase n=1 Tax=Thalassobellus sediminis TaxID=3367753 RepID=UPI0037AE650D